MILLKVVISELMRCRDVLVYRQVSKVDLYTVRIPRSHKGCDICSRGVDSIHSVPRPRKIKIPIVLSKTHVCRPR